MSDAPDQVFLWPSSYGFLPVPIAACAGVVSAPLLTSYSKRYAHSAWPAKWQGFLVLLHAQMVLFLVDEMKFNGDSRHCWDGWTLLKHIKFLWFWKRISKALGFIFQALGVIFDVFLVPRWPNCHEWPQVSKKEAFFHEKLIILGSFWGSI